MSTISSCNIHRYSGGLSRKGWEPLFLSSLHSFTKSQKKNIEVQLYLVVSLRILGKYNYIIFPPICCTVFKSRPNSSPFLVSHEKTLTFASSVSPSSPSLFSHSTIHVHCITADLLYQSHVSTLQLTSLHGNIHVGHGSVHPHSRPPIDRAPCASLYHESHVGRGSLLLSKPLRS